NINVGRFPIGIASSFSRSIPNACALIPTIRTAASHPAIGGAPALSAAETRGRTPAIPALSACSANLIFDESRSSSQLLALPCRRLTQASALRYIDGRQRRLQNS